MEALRTLKAKMKQQSQEEEKIDTNKQKKYLFKLRDKHHKSKRNSFGLTSNHLHSFRVDNAAELCGESLSQYPQNYLKTEISDSESQEKYENIYVQLHTHELSDGETKKDELSEWLSQDIKKPSKQVPNINLTKI